MFLDYEGFQQVIKHNLAPSLHRVDIDNFLYRGIVDNKYFLVLDGGINWFKLKNKTILW